MHTLFQNSIKFLSVEEQLLNSSWTHSFFPINNRGWSIMHEIDANVKFYHSLLSLPGKKLNLG